ncbi:MAG: quinone-dependent dihydroorotate dehydrogenase [Flavobacteriales bacterium]|jgi:dihydroorotate dehydrogenase|nr:quinone-dependent dihydroorotate dehydrogenase [Flavobacteriales bacterium]
MYKNILKPLLFLLTPEKAHYFSMGLLSFATCIPGVAWVLKQCFKSDDSCKRVTICGIEFPNVVGLAAGFDKDALWLKELQVLGFGHVEIGTLTPLPQSGNPTPRLFRLPKDSALLNRMGFNNGGVKDAVSRLKRRPSNLIVGGNIGRNKITSNENATSDYLKCFESLHPYVDYFTVNVSSPNTPGLRELQDRKPLAALLRAIVKLNLTKAMPRPVFLKIAPDLTDSQLDDVVSIIIEEGVDGLIATNTTVSRESLFTDLASVDALGSGGISGVPARRRSTEVIRYVHEKSSGVFPIIGVGGIDSVESAQEKLDAGASLVQIYSGMIYEGPTLAKKIANGVT